MSDEFDLPIKKKIVHAGKGSASPPDGGYPEETRLQFHFVTKLMDDEGKVIDDSRFWDKPMELVIGKKFKFEVWETCLKTMAVGEVSSFKVDRMLTSNYPAVAKTLRDTFNHLGTKKCAKDPHKHTCAMMAMQMDGGLGYDDLNELVEKTQPLEFIIELVAVDYPEQYEKETWLMEPDEKLESVSRLRAEGNELFKQGKYSESSEKYAHAIVRIDQLMLREKPEDSEWLSLRELKVPLMLNYSQSQIYLEQYYAAIEQCTEVLEIQPDNVKALYRRAKSYSGAWDPVKAKADLHRVIKLDPSLATACAIEIKKLDEMEKKKNAEDKEKLKNLFK